MDKNWNDFIAQHPEANILQTSAWGALKSEFGWYARTVLAGDSGAQVLFRKLPFGFTIAYIPKGPLGELTPGLQEALDKLCNENKAIFLKIEPDIWEMEGGVTTLPGYKPAVQEIQPRRTIVVDISPSEDEIMAKMKQKTRYNIRLAKRKEVVVEAVDDIEKFYEIMTVTGQRDEFGVHSKAYYQAAYDLFGQDEKCVLLIASYEGTPLAGVMAFRQGENAYYLYGASNNKERNRMPTYLLQWEAILWAKTHGCASYDLWGVPDAGHEELEENFTRRNDGLWGVYRHKRGYGGQLLRSVGSFDKVYNPLMYSFYSLYLKLSRREI